ncbi:MAG TPA: NUDIX domain-containing protein [Patescibacteria group bacterium]|nr:NUDIX domain-containing protein [Patescibacteria group bacterium]
MKKQSAGIWPFRRREGQLEVLLLHLAGPIWGHKDTWSIPKGELTGDEDHMAAAKREFEEELGILPPAGDYIDLGELPQSDKTNYIWAVEAEIDVDQLALLDTFTMEWPPKSGQQAEFLENDRAAWFDLPTAKTKMFKSQVPYVDRLAAKLGVEVAVTEDVADSQQSLF